MSSHFSWYPSTDAVTIPWNARYAFPSQSNKTNKSTPRIPPKNGAYFVSGQTIRLEFPAQGYVNPQHTTIIFDAVLNVPTASVADGGSNGAVVAANSEYACRFQNNIQSIFQRVRLLYGGTVLEDMNNYNQIVRNLTEWTSTSPYMTMDQATINEGIGGVVMGYSPSTVVSTATTPSWMQPINVRQALIQGLQTTTTSTSINGGTGVAGKSGSSNAPPGYTAISGYTPITQRYQVQLALGLFTQEKLIPTKFMASQLAIEITLEQSANCIFTDTNTTGSSELSAIPTFGVGNVILLPEVLEFDPSYDAMFLKGLQEGGVPIKFSTWNTYFFSTASQSNVNLNISERQRSVKSIFVVQRRSQPSSTADNGATFMDTANVYNGGSTQGSTLQQYQFRIGARYFPGQPVQCSAQVGSAVPNSGTEAWIELSKALKIVGDYRLSCPVNTTRWAVIPDASSTTILPEYDFNKSIKYFANATGIPTYMANTPGLPSTLINSASGITGSACFAMAINLETSNGIDISGLNAEEQSDISFLATWKQPQTTGSSAIPANLEVYTFVDTMLVLRENNMIELIK